MRGADGRRCCCRRVRRLGVEMVAGSGGFRALRRTPRVGEVLVCWIGSERTMHRAEVLQVWAAVCSVRLDTGAVVRVNVVQLGE